MRRPLSILLLALAAQSCTDMDLPPPVLLSVDPNAISNGTSAPLTVHGANFYAEVFVDFDNPAQSQVNATVDLELIHPDGRRFPLTGVTLVSEVEIDGVSPAGTSPQTYDLFLADSFGRTALLPNALQIFSGNCSANGSSCSTGNPCTMNDTCQGHRCQAGTSLPDCTPCQLAYAGEICLAGVCTPCLANVCTPPLGGCP